MKTYKITANGTAYDVVVEEVASDGAVSAPVSTAAPVVPAKAPAPAKKAAAPAGGAGSIKVVAPMPGKILSLKVAAGASVKKDQVVAILEAMKMEN